MTCPLLALPGSRCAYYRAAGTPTGRRALAGGDGLGAGRAGVGVGRGALDGTHVVDVHRAVETLQRQLPQRLRVDKVLDHQVDALADQDLAGGRLATQARGQVGNATDGAVVVAALEADAPERGVAHGDP